MSATPSQLVRSSGGQLYRLAAVSGLITGVSAAGVLFAWRNPSPDVVQHFTRIRFGWRTVAGFTAAQEMALAAHWVSSFATANYTGGTDLSNPASNPAFLRRDAVIGASLTEPKNKTVLATGNVRIADTGALSHAGSPVIQTHPFLWDGCAELAAAATVHKGRADALLDPNDFGDQPVGSDAGFIVRAPIALGAGGTGRLSVEVCWFER